MNWEGQLGVGYDPFAKPTMNDRNLRIAAVCRVVFARRNSFSRHADRIVGECELRPH
jgi:hypothetical protein